MNSILPELIQTDGEFSLAPTSPQKEGDDQLLDSYSKTIAAVVNRVAPTVVNIRVQSGERGAGRWLGIRRRARWIHSHEQPRRFRRA